MSRQTTIWKGSRDCGLITWGGFTRGESLWLKNHAYQTERVQSSKV